MTTLHLGVVDYPYEKGGKTTGDVAQILEDKYHIMEIFSELHLPEIAGILEIHIATDIQDLISGATPNNNSMIAAMGEIKDMFVKFIDTKEMDGVGFPGVPTEASLKGINHRFVHPYAKGNPIRPSFRDTGNYEDHFWSEIEK